MQQIVKHPGVDSTFDSETPFLTLDSETPFLTLGSVFIGIKIVCYIELNVFESKLKFASRAKKRKIIKLHNPSQSECLIFYH